ncbi:MAG: hypothetical protein DRI91_03860 [Aquificota bacterium]|nr:MAG: hypothetical protein DRI91_03860 [Aquificota bacterium]
MFGPSKLAFPSLKVYSDADSGKGGALCGMGTLTASGDGGVERAIGTVAVGRIIGCAGRSILCIRGLKYWRGTLCL